MSFEVVSPVEKTKEDLPAITVPHALRLYRVEEVSNEAAKDERLANEHRSQVRKRLKTLLDSKTVTHLEISGDVYEALGNDFTFPPDLETLWLNNVYLSSPELKKIVEKIVQLHHLKTLVLDIAITDSEVALLAKMTTLERVAIGAVRPETQSEIVNNDLEPALSNSALVELAKLKNLTTLFVGGRFSKKGIQELGTLSKLQTLGVFSTEKVDSLAALSQLENLTTLSLSMVPMWDFADFVACKRLKVLQLELKSFPTRDEMEQIAKMSSLEHLRIKWVNQDFNRLRGLRLLNSTKLHSLYLTGRFEISGFDEIETLSSLRNLGIGKIGANGSMGIDNTKLPEEYRTRLGKLTEIEYIDLSRLLTVTD